MAIRIRRIWNVDDHHTTFFKYVTRSSEISQFLVSKHFDAIPITIGYLVTEL